MTREIKLNDLIILTDWAKCGLRMGNKGILGFSYSNKQLLNSLNNVLNVIGDIEIKVKHTTPIKQ